MPIPTSTVSDIILGYLVRRYPDQIEEWQPLEPIAEKLVPFFTSHNALGFESDSDNTIPRVFIRAIRNLERKLYIEYDNVTGHIKLTSMGAFVALLHEFPEELLQ